jgi:S-DNA-T family DNA segregation ATPase FtsK/SpoIIIE
LWVADKGKLGGGAGPWPLLHDGACDVFDGVPVGRSQRGTIAAPPLFETNWLIGGRPGQGKSAAMRTLLLGAALDPSAELWVFVMGESPDFEPFRPRLGRYHMGMDDAVPEAALQALQDLLVEMERRGKVLGAQPGRPPKIRKLADNPRLGLHPLVVAIDECHELFTHPTTAAKPPTWPYV